MSRRARKGLAFLGGGVLAVVGFLVGVFVMWGSDPAAASTVNPAAVDLSALDRVPAGTWEKLAEKRVLFGHQSVGADIVAGLEAITKKKPQIKLRIAESREASAFDQPGFVHTKVGANENGDSKLTDFAAILKSPLGQKADIALMKFCYVDLTSGGDPAALFKSYQSAMMDLAASSPKTKFVHVTVPLTTIEAGPKAKVKRLIGRDMLGGYGHNLNRQKYNDSLAAAFKGAPVFDLAKSEATLPDGKVARFETGGVTALALTSGYTTDGGHLNEAGRLAAARDLLLVLAEQCR